LGRARAAGVDAALIRVENFDEAMRDLLRLLPDLDTQVLDSFEINRRRWSAAPKPVGKPAWPLVRLNALHVTQTPTVCRRVVCGVGGYAETRAAAEKAGAKLIVARTKAGVLAFGSDNDVRSAFDAHDITVFDLHTIETKRLRSDTGERGLLRDALASAICRARGLELIRHRNADVLFPADAAADRWAPLRALAGGVTGTVPRHPGLRWYEGIQTRLDWADDRLWLLVEPRVVFAGMTKETKDGATDFARERTVRRYNRQLNDLLMFWARILAAEGQEMRALNIADGVDAVFRLSSEPASSRRAGA
jgi:hypothetical protein